MGEAKRRAIQEQEIARAHSKLRRALYIRCLYFHVLPIIAVMIMLRISDKLLGPAAAYFGLSMMTYACLSIRDSVILSRSHVCERKNEPILFWLIVATFAATGLGMLIVALIFVISDD